MNKLRGISLMRNIFFILTLVLIIYSILSKYLPQYALNLDTFFATRKEIVSDDIKYHGLVITNKAGISSIRTIMDIKRRYLVGEMVVYEGRVGSSDIAVGICNDGKINATAMATTLILKCNISDLTLINTGTSLSKELKEDAIIIGNYIYQFDIGNIVTEKFPWVDRGNLFHTRVIAPNIPFRDNAYLNIEGLTKKVIISNIVTGDIKISNSTHADILKNTYGALISDSEAVAVGLVARKFNIPFTAISIISSYPFSNIVSFDIIERDILVSKIVQVLSKPNKSEN